MRQGNGVLIGPSRAQFILDGRITDRLREAGAFEGFPEGTPPQTIYRGLAYKRALELEERRDMAQTLISSLIAFTQGGEYLDIVGHLYPPEYKRDAERMKKETEDMNMSITVLDKFRAISERWD